MNKTRVDTTGTSRSGEQRRSIILWVCLLAVVWVAWSSAEPRSGGAGLSALLNNSSTLLSPVHWVVFLLALGIAFWTFSRR